MRKLLLIAVMSVVALAACADSWESGLTLCGTKVTSSNVDDLQALTKGQVTGGTITYDHENGILTLDGVTMERTDGDYSFLVFRKTADRSEYYIKINGHCVFDNKGITGKSIFIASEGVTLIFAGINNNPAKDGIDIYTGNGILGMEDAIIRCKNLSIEFKEIFWAFGGWSSASRAAELAFITCNVKAEDEEGIFDDINEFKLINCAFVTPEDATFNASKYYVESNGAKLEHVPVEIKVKKTDINNVSQEAQSKNRKVIREGQMMIERNGEIFNLDGARVE